MYFILCLFMYSFPSWSFCAWKSLKSKVYINAGNRNLPCFNPHCQIPAAIALIKLRGMLLNMCLIELTNPAICLRATQLHHLSSSGLHTLIRIPDCWRMCWFRVFIFQELFLLTQLEHVVFLSISLRITTVYTYRKCWTLPILVHKSTCNGFKLI